MKDNLILFPRIKKTNPSENDPNSTQQNELEALRAAFDRAREEWPIELSELPEKNKICFSTKS